MWCSAWRQTRDRTDLVQGLSGERAEDTCTWDQGGKAAATENQVALLLPHQAFGRKSRAESSAAPQGGNEAQSGHCLQPSFYQTVSACFREDSL